ncbi:hypothetical protein [Nocardia sp. NPDC024068]|uniref:hypothetical protein n=1 Tax=Nocardia sp. NPDC024068 TaxID=3157197 RepID=UPI0033DCC0C7
MTIVCLSCSWPAPGLVSAHGAVRYWRCVCGQWLVTEDDRVTASPGPSDLAARRIGHRASGPPGRTVG